MGSSDRGVSGPADEGILALAGIQDGACPPHSFKVTYSITRGERHCPDISRYSSAACARFEKGGACCCEGNQCCWSWFRCVQVPQPVIVPVKKNLPRPVFGAGQSRSIDESASEAARFLSALSAIGAQSVQPKKAPCDVHMGWGMRDEGSWCRG